MGDQPKPLLAELLEAIAEIMELDVGQTRLELEFKDGHLRRWHSHDVGHGRESLRPFEDRARWLHQRIAEGRPT